jgi:hypothetical protein
MIAISISLKKSTLGKNLHHDHVSDTNVHFPCMRDVSAIKVAHLSLEQSFSFVYSWIASNLYHSIVNLP